ncbi:MAG: serine/threonine protein kinase, partial [Planctomycetes bacterium]|nr:serine/threonine protein kinase [Planctomycetota bacterium]
MSDAEWSYASALIELEEEATEGPGALGSPAVGSEIGPFAVEANLGRGAMGEVFQVRYRGRSFALKLLANEDPRQRERLAREAQLVGALDHPGIVRLHGAGSVDDRTFLLYALVPAARRLSEAWAGLELTERVELIAAVAEAVGHAHAQGVVHRDLKPENVLVDGAGRPWVIDFGLATHADLGRLTQSGALLGTPSYMAPEQFAVEGALQRPPVDVWSLGVLLYEALTGTLPFPATTVLELSVLLQRCAPRPPRALVPEVPRAVEAVCLRALRLAQDERPPDG